MNEERMIRITKPESLDGEVSIRLFFDYYRPDGMLSKEGMTINDIDDLPLAPPKDWRPSCWIDGRPDMKIKMCRECPWLKECCPK
ncbi:MAG: hypothetical protein WCO84_06525 [bacterium]